MMYITRSEMILRFGEGEMIQLTDRSMQGVIDSEVLDMAIADANGEVNTYIQERYPSLSTVPFPLKRKAGDIARYYLYDNNPTEHVKNEFDNAIAWLRSVAAGKVSLGPNEAGKPTPSNNGAEMVTSGHVFGRSDTGFI